MIITHTMMQRHMFVRNGDLSPSARLSLASKRSTVIYGKVRLPLGSSNGILFESMV